MDKNFVSKSTIDNKKKAKTEYLKEKLKQTREDYESVKRKKALEEERGDATWILPSLADRIESDDRKEKKKKKKEKKEKKHKKKSKKHKHKKESDENEWEEAGPKENEESKHTETRSISIEPTIDTNTTVPKNTPIERDDWMMASSLLDVASKATFSRESGKTKQRKDKQKKEAEDERLEIQTSRELNPFWKDGGTGLPSDQQLKTSAEVTKNETIGDGGKSWLEKSYDRALKQAKEQGVSVEDVISKRYGSMDKFNAMLKAAQRTSSSRSHTSAKTQNINSSGRSGGWRKSRPTEESTKETEMEPTRTKHAEDQETKKETLREYSSSEASASSSGEDSDKEEEIEYEDIPLSEKEKNELSAKILRAELMGDDDLTEKLKERLETGCNKVVKRSAAGSNDPGNDGDGSGATGDREVILTRSDKHGNLYPIQLQTDTDELNKKRKRQKKKIIATHDTDGKRTKYFEDDDRMDLKALVQQERMTTSDDQTAQMARLASKHLGKAQGDDYTLDDMFVTASATRGTTQKEDKRTKEQAVKEHKQRELQLDSCRFCFENPKITKHLIIAIGRKTYLALPMNKSLVEGHCLILPLHHVIGQTYMDEDVLAEVKLFKDALVRMFSKQNEDAIFVETCKNLRHQNHCIVECIPIEKELGDMCPIYFKKALMETGSEWSQNKKVVTVTRKDGVSKAIPKGLPYFSVEFGMDGGFGHIIEEEDSFPHYFGKEILGGMMDLEPSTWRKPPKQSFDMHKRKVLKFSEMWKSFDWTRDLEK